jgi:hypothetical protein
MPSEFISKKLRMELREYFVSTTCRVIEQEFDAADISCDNEYDPQMSGERRSLVERYYHSLDFTKWSNAKKVISVLENVLITLCDTAAGESIYTSGAEKQFKILINLLQRDGYRFVEGRIIRAGNSATIHDAQDIFSTLNAPELDRQIDRIKSSIDDDPSLAIGTAKELIETVCKTILKKYCIEIDPNWDLLKLCREVRRELKLLPEDIPDESKGSDVIKRLLQSLATVVQNMSELRNLYGTGHGRHGTTKAIHPRHARLAVAAASAIASFLIETDNER